jgi:hypothetical protein
MDRVALFCKSTPVIGGGDGGESGVEGVRSDCPSPTVRLCVENLAYIRKSSPFVLSHRK